MHPTKNMNITTFLWKNLIWHMFDVFTPNRQLSNFHSIALSPFHRYFKSKSSMCLFHTAWCWHHSTKYLRQLNHMLKWNGKRDSHSHVKPYFLCLYNWLHTRESTKKISFLFRIEHEVDIDFIKWNASKG